MRFLAATLVLLCGCERTVSDEFEFNLRRVFVMQPPQQFDAGPPPPLIDPCVWDGGGQGVCQAVTASAFDGTSCVGLCTSREPGEPGLFAPGQCQAACEAPPPCGWNGVGERDAGASSAWAFEGPGCIPISGVDAGQPGVFATKEDCETTCPCDESKLWTVFWPMCSGEYIVDENTVPPVKSVFIDGRYRQVHSSEWQTSASAAELCRATLAPNVIEVRCLGGE